METVIALVVAALAVAALVAREIVHRGETSRLRRLLADARAASSKTQDLASVGAMVSDLAQELKGPLQGVLGNTELMLLKADRNDEGAEELREIRHNAARAAGIVRNLLTVADTSNLKRSWYDVNAIVCRATETCRTEVEADRVGIDLAPSTRLPLVYVDGRQLEKVLATFIGRAGRLVTGSNAADRVNVSVTTERRTQPDDRLLIDIDDDGTPGPSDESFGDGGLAACTRIIEAHGGSVTVEDRSRGVHVHLEFPVTADAAAADARLPGSSNDAAEAAASRERV